MKKIDNILKNTIYKESLKKLQEYEKDREFCNHTLEHFIDVSRIAYIMVLEEGLDYSKEVIYAIGLLHDIGRVLEYEQGTPHNEASVTLAKEILKENTFTDYELKTIFQAIDSHRKNKASNEKDSRLFEIIYKSDKLSRNCFNCSASSKCYWDSEKKNNTIKF